MARKKRDYKAEYAASKRRAQAAGYKSEREYKRVRKVLGIPRGAQPVPPRLLQAYSPASESRIRREAREWSKAHSRIPGSRYNPGWSEKRVRAYHDAFVKYPAEGSRRGKARAKRKQIWQYYRDWMGDTTEWNQDWVSDLQAT